ncbi:MAG: 5-oxoprolinase subunit PxpB [Clostridia bacterium]|nr:5-oxoprolinase subunit PxpB [Clostridia bacterium]
MYSEPRFLLAGDKGLNMEFGNEINEKINQKIRATTAAISQKKIPGIKELIPTYRSLLIIYEPLEISLKDLISQLKEIQEGLDSLKLPEPIVSVIPVLYGGEMGPDLDFVARHNNLSPEEVIEIHTSADYLFYMLGFTPGFTYLGGMSEKIATPRLKTPRTKIPAGSVGIAGSQTGIYPIESPGGWQLIGRTPLKLYDPLRETPVLFQAGNYIRFKAVDKEEYERIGALVQENKYTPETYPLLTKEGKN